MQQPIETTQNHLNVDCSSSYHKILFRRREEGFACFCNTICYKLDRESIFLEKLSLFGYSENCTNHYPVACWAIAQDCAYMLFCLRYTVSRQHCRRVHIQDHAHACTPKIT